MPRNLRDVDVAIDNHLSNPGTSYWLREAVRLSRERDPVDALNDAEQLVAMLRERLDPLFAVAARSGSRQSPTYPALL